MDGSNRFKNELELFTAIIVHSLIIIDPSDYGLQFKYISTDLKLFISGAVYSLS